MPSISGAGFGEAGQVIGEGEPDRAAVDEDAIGAERRERPRQVLGRRNRLIVAQSREQATTDRCSSAHRSRSTSSPIDPPASKRMTSLSRGRSLDATLPTPTGYVLTLPRRQTPTAEMSQARATSSIPSLI